MIRERDGATWPDSRVLAKGVSKCLQSVTLICDGWLYSLTHFLQIWYRFCQVVHAYPSIRNIKYKSLCFPDGMAIMKVSSGKPKGGMKEATLILQRNNKLGALWPNYRFPTHNKSSNPIKLWVLWSLRNEQDKTSARVYPAWRVSTHFCERVLDYVSKYIVCSLGTKITWHKPTHIQLNFVDGKRRSVQESVRKWKPITLTLLSLGGDWKNEPTCVQSSKQLEKKENV